MWYVAICITHYISTSPTRKLGNNIDIIDYFAGDE